MRRHHNAQVPLTGTGEEAHRVVEVSLVNEVADLAEQPRDLPEIVGTVSHPTR